MFLNSFSMNCPQQLGYGNAIPLVKQNYTVQIQMFGSPRLPSQLDVSTNQCIYNQLKAFEQTLQNNYSIIMKLVKNVNAVSNYLNDINVNIEKEKNNTKHYKNNCHSSQKLGKQDPFLETKLRNDFNLMNRVFGEHVYKYELKLNESFCKVLYKERNFKLSIKLIDTNGQTIVNSNRIPITFKAYHDEENPKLIQNTRCKIPIFKGNNQSEIYKGQGLLTKLQVKEVSSFYSTKGIFFVMFAKAQSLKSNNNALNFNERNINYDLIRPLIIRDIIVKAKK